MDSTPNFIKLTHSFIFVQWFYATLLSKSIVFSCSMSLFLLLLVGGEEGGRGGGGGGGGVIWGKTSYGHFFHIKAANYIVKIV